MRPRSFFCRFLVPFLLRGSFRRDTTTSAVRVTHGRASLSPHGLFLSPRCWIDSMMQVMPCR